MADKKFIDGVFVDEFTFPDGGTKTTITVTDKFMQFYADNKKPNSKGNNQMKFDVKKSQAGKIYAELNQFVPKPQAPQPKETEESFAEEFDDDLDIF